MGQSKGKLKNNRIHRNDNLSRLNPFLDEIKSIGIKVTELTPYQIRFSLDNRKIDYYPTSGKYFDINTQKWGKIEPEKIIWMF